jgi:hypothetical protein
VKGTPKIGEKIDVGESLKLHPAYFLELLAPVIGDFALGSFTCESCVPRAAFRSIEPATQRIRMGERRIDDMGVRNTEDQLPHRNSGKNPGFTEQPVVGSALELKQCVQVSRIIGKARQNGFIAVAVFSGDQAVGIVA